VRHYSLGKFWPTIGFLNVFFLIYAFVPLVYYSVRIARQDLSGFWITIPNVAIAFAYSFGLIRQYFSTQAVAVPTSAYAVIFLGMAAYLYYHCQPENLRTVVLLLATGIFFLVISVPILFSQHWITVFWSLQGVVLLWAATRLHHQSLRDAALLLLLIALGKFVVYDYPGVFHLQVEKMLYGSGFAKQLLERWATSALVLVTLFRSARMLGATPPMNVIGGGKLHSMLDATCGALLFLVLNVETATFFHDYALSARFAAISVLWALLAIALMVLGFFRNSKAMRYCSIALFAMTLLKIFLRDMANVRTPYRILSFMVLGMFLIGASYLYHRYKARILPASSAEN